MIPQILTMKLKISSMDAGAHRFEVLLDGEKIGNIVSLTMEVIVGPNDILDRNHVFIDSLKILEKIPKFQSKLMAARI